VAIDITRRDHNQTFQKPTTQNHQFRLQPFRGYVLEVEDVHFHHDSAVFSRTMETPPTPHASPACP